MRLSVCVHVFVHACVHECVCGYMHTIITCVALNAGSEISMNSLNKVSQFIHNLYTNILAYSVLFQLCMILTIAYVCMYAAM